MSLAVTFRHAARAEFIEAAAWYEAQRLGFGVEFIDEIEQCVALAADQPRLYAVVHNGIRRVVAGYLATSSMTRRFVFIVPLFIICLS